MDDYCSPQWVDFTSNPDEPLDDYFERNHEICEDNRRMEIPQIKITSEDLNIKNTPKKQIVAEKLEEELNIIKNTPIKVIYSSSLPRSSSKQEIVKQVTYDDIMQEAIETFKHCLSEETYAFKKPMLNKNKVTKSLKFHTMDNNQTNDLNKCNKKINQAKEDVTIQEIKVSPSSINDDDHLKQTKNDIDKKPLINNFNSNISPNICSKNNKSDANNPDVHTPTNNTTLLRLSSSTNKRQSISLEQSHTRRSKPTYLCRRQSLKFRRSSNRYISLAAAVQKFQNQTPERFHTKSSKELNTKSVSAKKPSFLTRRSMPVKLNLQKCELGSNKQEEEKSNTNVNKDLEDEKCTPRHVTETSKTINLRRSCVLSSSKTSHSKHVVSTIVDNNGSGIVLKKEKILFFDIPIHSKQKKTTRPIPFSFENRDKAKKQSKVEQSQLKDNKLGNVKKSQSSQEKACTNSSGLKNNENNSCSKNVVKNDEVCKPVESNALKYDSSEKDKSNDKKVIKNAKSVKGTLKMSQSTSMSSLKSCGKAEDKSKINEHTQNKATKQLKKQSASMSSLVKSKYINKDNQAKDSVQVKKSSLEVCKEKNRNDNKKTESLKIQNDLCKVKTESNLTSANATLLDKKRQSQANLKQKENKPPNVNTSTNDNLNQTECMKTKGVAIGMNSYERAKQRQEFDKKIKQKIMTQEELRQKAEANRLAKEKQQIALIRKQFEIKARPMPIFKPPVIIKSTKQLTNPQSPAWAYKKKTN